MRYPRINVIAIGHVESTLTDPETAPLQGHEGPPDAWLVINTMCSKASKAFGQETGPYSEARRHLRGSRACFLQGERDR
jgi:hypothetical protein